MLERADRGVGEILRTLERLGMAQSQRQDIAKALRPLLAAWEADVDAEAKSGETRVASPADRR